MQMTRWRTFLAGLCLALLSPMAMASSCQMTLVQYQTDMAHGYQHSLWTLAALANFDTVALISLNSMCMAKAGFMFFVGFSLLPLFILGMLVLALVFRRRLVAAFQLAANQAYLALAGHYRPLGRMRIA